MQPLLTARDLACRRGDRLLFSGLSFEIGPGGVLHVAGPNGTGKTSLIRILAGLLRPFAGSIERDGAIALLDNNHSLEPRVPLGDALKFWAELDGTVKELPNAAERMGLGDLLDVPIRYLSTGQLKRAAMTRVLGQSAPVWLLDEPLNGLDRAGITIVENLIGEHLARGGLAVIASHQTVTLARTPERIELGKIPA